MSLDEGTLIIFDRRPKALPIAERTLETTDEQTPTGRPVTLLRACPVFDSGRSRSVEEMGQTVTDRIRERAARR